MVNYWQDAAKSLGMGKQSPDEFQVVTRAPLALPPDFNLRPPSPGAPRPQEASPRAGAQAALLGTDPLNAPLLGGPSGTPNSAGESALLSAAGTERAIPDIRSVVERETSVLASESDSFTDTLVFWREPESFGTAVDPAAETRRIQENQALGRSVSTGRTPTIERRQQGILEGLF
ncbi:MAG: DUF3035 domain-containing protein [Rhodospirillaceae bacterium]